MINSHSATYYREFANLQAKTSNPLPLVRQLRLFLVEDIFSCGGRIRNASLYESARFPILLPQNHHRNTHKKPLHSGLNSTLNHLHQRYWIPTGRQYAKKNHSLMCHMSEDHTRYLNHHHFQLAELVMPTHSLLPESTLRARSA